MKEKVLCPFLLVLVLSLTSGAQEHRTWKSQGRKVVESENAVLRARIDSLQSVLDSLMAAREVEDNAVDALLDGDSGTVDEQVLDAGQTDSLLNLWYQSNRPPVDYNVVCGYESDSVQFTSNVPDSVMIQRLLDMNAYITIPFNETVRRYMVLYAEKMPERMGRILGLSAYYFPIFEETFDRYGIPLELKYMSVIESMLSPTATSRVGAKGIWQFMYRTARIYGLNIDSFIDERMDVPRAADAAARYLKDAYNVFGDWTLAISSYNCGPGNVSKAIRRSGGKKDFWSIYPYLPRETRGYVPAFVGAMYAMTYYREYGLQPADVGMPARTDTFMISRKLHFKQVNEVVGVPMEDLQNLNPQYVHDIVPGTVREACVLTLPYKWTGPFLDVNQDSLYNHRLKQLMSDDVLKAAENHRSHTRTAYKVKNGDYLGRIAAKHHVTVSQIKKWNHLKSDRIRVGQILYIYPR